jgi:hypothetical protein
VTERHHFNFQTHQRQRGVRTRTSTPVLRTDYSAVSAKKQKRSRQRQRLHQQHRPQVLTSCRGRRPMNAVPLPVVPLPVPPVLLRPHRLRSLSDGTSTNVRPPPTLRTTAVPPPATSRGGDIQSRTGRMEAGAGEQSEEGEERPEEAEEAESSCPSTPTATARHRSDDGGAEGRPHSVPSEAAAVQVQPA